MNRMIGNGFKLTLLILIFSSTLMDQALSGQQLSPDREVRMLALGDSYTIGESVKMTERWPHQFVARLTDLGFDVKTPDYIATTGWTTRDLLEGIEAGLDREKDYNLVSILIGVNNQYQGKVISVYEPELREIIDQAMEIVDQDAKRVFILSIPDYAYTPFGKGDPKISKEIDAYNAINRRVAVDYGIAWFDITPISRKGLDESGLLARDELHPSGEQYGAWVSSIIRELELAQ